LATAALVGGGVLVTDLVRPVPRSAPLATGSGEVLLASGTETDGPWRLLGRAEGRCLTLVRTTSEGGACDLADPPRLEETSVLSVDERADAVTLVAGLAPEGAVRIVVDPTVGDPQPAELREGAGLTWFVLRLDTVTGVDAITTTDASGAEVARLTTPLPPPPPPLPDTSSSPLPESLPSEEPPATSEPSPSASAVHAPPAVRLAETDEFGRVTAVREADGGLEVDVDRVDMLDGQAAAEAAAAHGDPLDTDYYLVDDNPTTRTYRVPAGAVVWGSIGLSRQVEPVRVSQQRWREFVQTDLGRRTLFHLDVEDGAVVGIEEQYLP
ncbi:MAG: hypothetical protein JWO60_2510, partial [Frankiales bacterium]|nr:hypothetical protein [Frankiales bacterium]